MSDTIIWATDGSENADLALQHAKRLGMCDGGKVVAVHSEEFLLAPGTKGATPLQVDETEIKQRISKRLEELNQNGTNATLRIVQPGAPGTAHAIAAVADELDAKLIAVGTRGHSPIAGVLLGSVAQRLLSLAHRPVLAIPPA